VKAKVVITDYVWESLDVERKTLGELAELVPLKTKKPEEFLDAAKRLRRTAQTPTPGPSPPT